MRFSLFTAISDIFFIIRLRLKLIRKDPVTMLVLSLSVLIFAWLLRSLTVSADNLSTLPVGIVDYDNSESSRELTAGLEKTAALRIITGSEENLHKQLLDEMIAGIFVIEKGYGDRLKSGKLKDLITMYYKENNKSASILADIVAGEIIYPAGLYQSFRYYEQLKPSEGKLGIDQYKEFMKSYVEKSSDFDFAFRILHKNPIRPDLTGKQLENSMIYNQLIFAILGIMMAFISMFILSQTIYEKEIGVESRLQLTGMHILKRDTGNIFALVLCNGVLSVLYTALFIRQTGSVDLKLGLSIYLLLILNSIVLGSVMLLISKFMKRMLPYQFWGAALILITGGFGFYHLLSGFYQSSADRLVKFIPNSWFIQGFTDIIIYGNEGGYLKEGHHALAEMSAVVISLIIVIDLVQGLNLQQLYKRRLKVTKRNGGIHG